MFETIAITIKSIAFVKSVFSFSALSIKTTTDPGPSSSPLLPELRGLFSDLRYRIGQLLEEYAERFEIALRVQAIETAWLDMKAIAEVLDELVNEDSHTTTAIENQCINLRNAIQRFAITLDQHAEFKTHEWKAQEILATGALVTAYRYLGNVEQAKIFEKRLLKLTREMASRTEFDRICQRLSDEPHSKLRKEIGRTRNFYILVRLLALENQRNEPRDLVKRAIANRLVELMDEDHDAVLPLLERDPDWGKVMKELLLLAKSSCLFSAHVEAA
jgi:hypothetical protein